MASIALYLFRTAEKMFRKPLPGDKVLNQIGYFSLADSAGLWKENTSDSTQPRNVVRSDCAFQLQFLHKALQ